jgi:hypothetical protein
MDSASLCSLVGQYDNPVPTGFLAPTDCSKIPAQATWAGGIDSLEPIPGLIQVKKFGLWRAGTTTLFLLGS